MKQIALRSRSGQIRGFALVDDADLELVSNYTWCDGGQGYAQTTIPHPNGGFRRDGVRKRRTKLYMHRLICGLEFGDKREPDHLNRNRLDNRRENLRIGTHAQNTQNHPGYGGKSFFRGVSWNANAKKWHAQGKAGNKRTHIGYFIDEAEAGQAAIEWRRKNMEFAEA